ncbi:increased DNA methylation 3-like [Tasmannia lanceolata]|uniref:increased DNA methylation 3-like n=1 Tax=Tasmannia lanceolata TaxID=3420 RepID=UPI0040630BC6
MGRPGPPVGLVNIGISKYAYIFQVALPGVSKDHSQFICEVQNDGKVKLRGWTLTGERVLRRDVSGEPQVFEMKTQHLCESGSFKVSFYLPGPVDPRLFKVDFYDDGILHAIIMKKNQRTNSLRCVPYTMWNGN